MRSRQKLIAILCACVAVAIAIAVSIALYRGPAVGIYLVRSGAFDTPLETWVLEEEPWISSERIERYDATSHVGRE